MKTALGIAIGASLLIAGTAFASTLKGISYIEQNSMIPNQNVSKYHDNDTGADCYAIVIQGEVPSVSISCVK